MKSYYNDGIVKPPLYYYRDKDQNEIDLLIADGDTLHPIEIKTTSDPTRSMVKAFMRLDSLPGIQRGEGGVVCFAKHALPLADNVLMIPVQAL